MKFQLLAALIVVTLGIPESMAHAETQNEPPAQVSKKTKQEKTGIQWRIAPGKVLVFLDGKKLGPASKLDFTAARPGKHSVKLTNGEDETELDIQVKKGQVIQVEFTFDEG